MLRILANNDFRLSMGITGLPSSIKVVLQAKCFNERELNEMENKMLALVNGERQSRVIRPMIFNEQIADVARGHSRDMVNRNFVDHLNPDGLDCHQRLSEAGIYPRMCGENIAKHMSVDRAHTGLMNSLGHRENILNEEFTHVGIGIVQHRDRYLIITQNFVRDDRFSGYSKTTGIPTRVTGKRYCGGA
jgi:uncharacterized protein YkwD